MTEEGKSQKFKLKIIEKGSQELRLKNIEKSEIISLKK